MDVRLVVTLAGVCVACIGGYLLGRRSRGAAPRLSARVAPVEEREPEAKDLDVTRMGRKFDLEAAEMARAAREAADRSRDR